MASLSEETSQLVKELRKAQLRHELRGFCVVEGKPNATSTAHGSSKLREDKPHVSASLHGSSKLRQASSLPSISSPDRLTSSMMKKMSATVIPTRYKLRETSTPKKSTPKETSWVAGLRQETPSPVRRRDTSLSPVAPSFSIERPPGRFLGEPGRHRATSRSPERRRKAGSPGGHQEASHSPGRQQERRKSPASTSSAPASELLGTSGDMILDTLLAACAKGDWEHVNRLLYRHSSRKLVDGFDSKMKRTPLHVAAHQGHASICAALLTHAADMQAQEKSGATPMILASLHGHLEVVKWLCRNGAYPECLDALGRNCLHCACLCAQSDVTKSLVQHFPWMVRTRDGSGHNALYFALSNPHGSSKLKILHTLLEAKCHVNEADDAGQSPLSHAMQRDDHASSVKLLLQFGARIVDDAKRTGGLDVTLLPNMLQEKDTSS